MRTAPDGSRVLDRDLEIGFGIAVRALEPKLQVENQRVGWQSALALQIASGELGDTPACASHHEVLVRW